MCPVKSPAQLKPYVLEVGLNRILLYHPSPSYADVKLCFCGYLLTLRAYGVACLISGY